MWIIILVLAVLSLIQRLVPWLILRKYSDVENIDRMFGYLAISAFATLMIENIPKITPVFVVSLIFALIVSLKTKNVGLAVLAAMAAVFISGFV